MARVRVTVTTGRLVLRLDGRSTFAVTRLKPARLDPVARPRPRTLGPWAPPLPRRAT